MGLKQMDLGSSPGSTTYQKYGLGQLIYLI